MTFNKRPALIYQEDVAEKQACLGKPSQVGKRIQVGKSTHMVIVGLLFWAGLFANTALAQTSGAQDVFEGEITYIFEPGPNVESEAQSDIKNMVLMSGANRILIRPTRVAENGKQDNDAILLRNDLRDIVLITDGPDVVRLTESELTSFIQMMQSFSSMMSSADKAASALDAFLGTEPQPQKKPEWLRTDEKKTFHGIRAVKWRYREPNDNKWVDLWLAEKERLDWSLLSGDWSSITSSVSGVDIDPSPFLRNGSFPLLMESYADNELTWKFSASEVRRKKVDASQLDIPKGRQVIGLSELLMKMMSGG